ncbi:uncharacterized protein [Rhodnius prolixus]|uniref:uncharacterized protein n=1 Tax=Rhodnius prolixus TaxID=13249 RepID=UPI003D18A0B1
MHSLPVSRISRHAGVGKSEAAFSPSLLVVKQQISSDADNQNGLRLQNICSAMTDTKLDSKLQRKVFVFIYLENRDVDCSQCLHHLLFADNQVIAQDLDSVEYINAEDVAR